MTTQEDNFIVIDKEKFNQEYKRCLHLSVNASSEFSRTTYTARLTLIDEILAGLYEF